MGDDNGNSKVANAVQDTKIDQIVKDIGEIKDTLRQFIDTTVDVRMHCSSEMGSIKTHIKVIWGFVSAIVTTVAVAVIRLIVTGGI